MVLVEPAQHKLNPLGHDMKNASIVDDFESQNSHLLRHIMRLVP